MNFFYRRRNRQRKKRSFHAFNRRFSSYARRFCLLFFREFEYADSVAIRVSRPTFREFSLRVLLTVLYQLELSPHLADTPQPVYRWFFASPQRVCCGSVDHLASWVCFLLCIMVFCVSFFFPTLLLDLCVRLVVALFPLCSPISREIGM